MPAILNRQKKRKGNGDTAIPAKKGCLFWGVANHLPIFLKGED